MTSSRLLVFVLLLFVLVSVRAAENAPEETIRASLAVFLPDLKPDSISATPVDGLYEVVFGPRLLYMTADGRFLVQGSILDLEQNANITEPRRNAVKARAVDAIGEENMIIYAPEKTRYTVTVFTDIDCAYCRKLHASLSDYLAQGIRIRYLFYPRAGLDSESYAKAVSVWCADDRKAAMTKAKKGEPIEMKTCPNPVSDHMNLGRLLSIRGTPALVLEDGDIIPGYVPPSQLAAALAERFPEKTAR